MFEYKIIFQVSRISLHCLVRVSCLKLKKIIGGTKKKYTMVEGSLVKQVVSIVDRGCITEYIHSNADINVM